LASEAESLAAIPTVTGFDEFFLESYRKLVRSMEIVFRDPSVAEDACQEAFAVAYRKWNFVVQRDRPLAWVYTVALNKGRRAVRKRQRFTSTSTDLSEHLPQGHEDPVAMRMWLWSGVLSLPTRERTAVVLRYLGDLSIDEVAKIMRCQPGTVKATLHHAVQKLRVELTNEETDA